MTVRSPAAGTDTAAAIREHAAALFFEKGYEATSLRTIAAAVGIKVGSLYHHIENKEQLLMQVMGEVMDDLLAQQDAAHSVDGDVIDRLLAVLECHIRFSASRARDVFIGNSELRALSPDIGLAIHAKRRTYERRIKSLIIQAGEQGKAKVIDARAHTFSVVARGTHVAAWYRPEGRLSLEQIVSIYSKSVLRELSVTDADARVDRCIDTHVPLAAASTIDHL